MDGKTPMPDAVDIGLVVNGQKILFASCNLGASKEDELGGEWRMPTDEEWTALRTQCTGTWTTQNGIYGRLVTSSNGNSIFLPAASYRFSRFLDNAGPFSHLI